MCFEPNAPKRADGAICYHSSYTKLVVFIVVLSCMPCGMVIYWEAVNVFIKHPHLSNPLTFLLAVAIGSYMVAMLMPNIGRRRPLIYASLNFLPAIVLNALYQGHHSVDLLTRLFAGVAIGATMTSAIVYLGEVVLPFVRGRHYALLALGYWLGAISYTVIYGRLGPWYSLFTLIFPVLFFILGLIYLPETPIFVMQIGHQRYAAEVLHFLRCGCTRCKEAELMQVRRFVFDSNCVHCGWSMLDRCLTMFLMCIFTHFTGFLPFVLTTVYIALYISYLIAAVSSLLGFICYYVMIAHITRSWMMFISYIGTLLAILGLFTSYQVEYMAGLYILQPIFYFFYFLGGAEMFFLLAGEVFPHKTKHFFVSFVVVAYFMALVLSGFVTKELFLAVGPELMLIYFAVHNFLAVLYAVFVVPGYERENFVQVQEYFDGEQ